MRIITGRARGVKLLTLEGSNTRPTADRTKEAIFSMLQFEIEGRSVLDLFSGSGQMALEALSRGAASAVLCDKAKEAVVIINKNAEKTRLAEFCTVVNSDHADCIQRMARMGKQFDIVFLDPPYASDLLSDALARMAQAGILKPTTTVICESGAVDFPIPAIYEIKKQSKYGIAYITILKLKPEEDR